MDDTQNKNPLKSGSVLRASTILSQAFPLAIEGLVAGDSKMLAKAASLGWNPSMAGDWMDIAMREPSGSSMRWLAASFPAAVALSLPVACPWDMGGKEKWGAEAMLVLEEFALEFGSTKPWLDACSKSAQAGRYFKSTLATNPLWTKIMEGGLEISSTELLKALCYPCIVQKNEEALSACVEFCATQLAKSMKIASESKKAVLFGAISEVVMKSMHNGLPLKLMGPMLDCLPEYMLRMGGCPLEKSKGAGAITRRDMEQALSNLRSRRGPRIDQNQVGGWEIGAYALVGNLDDFDYAMQKGWIQNMCLAVSQKCEHPDFIAHDELRVAAELGRTIDTTKRWSKCEQAIKGSMLDPQKKAKLLEKIASPDTKAWKPGDNKVFEVIKGLPSSPITLMFAADEEAFNPGCFQEKMERLREAGHRVKDAMSRADPLLSWAVDTFEHCSWAKSILEREELGDEVQPVPSGPKREPFKETARPKRKVL